jgi:type I restriction enzyme S subunit
VSLQSFFANFDRLIDASNGVAKLRELILDLAIQGKLTSQYKTDEPASVLFGRIVRDRRVSEKAKKTKNDSDSSLSQDSEPPFSIPQSWQWLRLGELGSTQTGSTPNKTVRTYFGYDYPFVKPADIFPDRVEYENEGLLRKAIDEGGRLARSGSILMVCIGTIGKVNVIERDCSFNQQINSITLYSDLDPYLFNYFLRSGYFQSEAGERLVGQLLPS